MDAVFQVPVPVNEPVRGYAPGSPERHRLDVRLKELEPGVGELPMTIGGVRRLGAGKRVDVVQPHRHAAVLGTFGTALEQDAQDAVEAALRAAGEWRGWPFEERAAVFLRAAELLAGPFRERVVAATMLGQSKTVQQAEIDAACELADFWRFNVSFARELLSDQPHSPAGVWNRADHRPLEGFVYAVTPFNFTAISGNLPTAPALMGNAVVWKPAPTQTVAACAVMEVLEEAGLPAGVVNLLTGDGVAVSRVTLARPELAGIHFTGSTRTFQHLWRTVGDNIGSYRTYPRMVGETGGKDFVVAHPSADEVALRVALVRGAFEYQGQKCSAVSRAYVPESLWRRMREPLAAEVDGLPMGDVADLSNFLGAVIDERAFGRLRQVLERAGADPAVQVVAGGSCDDAVGYFVRPTVLVCTDPGHEMFRKEYFGPVLSVFVYEDERYEEMLEQVERVSGYALTGAVFARDRAAVHRALEVLRFAAGNVYVNDKPTGAVVGQQPFGGGRASGTNDKAGSRANLSRWVSTRSIKETFVPPLDYRYPHMG
ncbi:1-pyrroline-5-carboxylate dehydrogenase [Wenjunlia vitaminophila]|uniref:L-glutamate gamma-semialdehyde dehydrogenase n=1 Tax=Wenjunlia vitaminophila TaxID=76728 RepID=A0A0T6LPC2_WENVI|nr:L-glutamate gamma-semialdehyde dehydrogenase [Wenjunlia vitaminophila]KRV47660.1 1-pyrroline-5-carboxylate dehydrogenase [Wenjunlia vitaminophila]